MLCITIYSTYIVIPLNVLSIQHNLTVISDQYNVYSIYRMNTNHSHPPLYPLIMYLFKF